MHHICPEVQAEHAFAMMHLQPLPIQFSLRDIEFRRSQKTTIVSGFFGVWNNKGSKSLESCEEDILWHCDRQTDPPGAEDAFSCAAFVLFPYIICAFVHCGLNLALYLCVCVCLCVFICNVQCSCFSALCVCSPQMLSLQAVGHLGRSTPNTLPKCDSVTKL